MALVERAIPVGGASLNFNIVGGTAEPSNPKENTIWVNTETAIGEWQFSGVEPTTRADGSALVAGDVWFKLGDINSAEFNALKKNAVLLQPNYTYQYSGSAWVKKVGQIYKDEAWAEIMGSIIFYSRGTTYVEWIVNQGTETGSALQFSGTTDSSTGANGNHHSDTPYFDITPFTVITFVFGGDGTGNQNGRIRVYDSSGNKLAEKTTGAAASGGVTYTIDVSALTGKAYIEFYHIPGNMCGKRTGHLYDLRIE